MQSATSPIVLSLFLACVSGLPTFAADASSDVFRRTLPAASGGRLVIDTDRGSIRVAGGSQNEVQVEVIRKIVGGSARKGAQLLERHRVDLTESNGTFRLEADLEGNDTWSFRGPRLEVDIRVTVPREFSLDAQTAGGAVHANGLKGDVAVRTSGGSLRLENIVGPVSGKTSGGSIHGLHLDGRVDLTTSGGSIDIEGVVGGPTKVSTSGGSIRLAGMASPIEARTAGGSIRLETSVGPVVAGTSGGSVDAVMTAPPKHDIELRSSAGGIALVLPSDAAFDLDASTSAGSVSSDFRAGPAKPGNRSSLVGPVNGGGPRVKLRTSAGSIRVRKH
ncbi:MAG: DUF4097 family beta strand repeat protein [Verrucomicrobiales bacterium]|nr:DUF4097 family beta strand repeat protein [Verrucomicrobiales bacterium]